MKSLWVCLSLSLSLGGCSSSEESSTLASATAPRRIVSDIDDTIKITNVQNPADAAASGVFSKAVFAGMATLYAEMETARRGSGADPVYLSGSPAFLEHKLHEALVEEHGFPEGDFQLKAFWPFPSTDRFKGRALREIYRADHLQLILIGDDTELDPEIYAAFKQEQGESAVIATYVRSVRGRALPDGEEAFDTAFDIALAEVAAGRLGVDAAVAVGTAVLAAGSVDPATVVPDYVVCRLGARRSSPDPVLADVALRIAALRQALCTTGHP